MMPMGKKKKPAPFEDLLGEEPMEDAGMEEGEFEEEEYSEDEGMEGFEEPFSDPLAAEGDMGMGGLDPEQAQLAETLGFTEPEQQQALIDLIKLVAAPAPSPVGDF